VFSAILWHTPVKEQIAQVPSSSFCLTSRAQSHQFLIPRPEKKDPHKTQANSKKLLTWHQAFLWPYNSIWNCISHLKMDSSILHPCMILDITSPFAILSVCPVLNRGPLSLLRLFMLAYVASFDCSFFPD